MDPLSLIVIGVLGFVVAKNFRQPRREQDRSDVRTLVKKFEPEATLKDQTSFSANQKPVQQLLNESNKNIIDLAGDRNGNLSLADQWRKL